jgi:cytochrome c biogenesis protein CcdA
MTVDTAFTIAFVAGVFATFNPCGFAMLPAYLSLAILDAQKLTSRRTQIFKALKFSGLMGVGIVGVFAIFSLVIFPISTSIQKYLPYVTSFLGLLILLFGATLIFKGPVLLKKIWSPNVPPTGSWSTYILYGVTFALGSISCTIGPFLAVTSTALGASLVESLFTYVFYGLGFVATISILAIFTALSKDLLIKKIRGAGGALEKFMGGLMALIGLYLIYFGINELAFQYGFGFNQSIADFAFAIQGTIIEFVTKVLTAIGLLEN